MMLSALAVTYFNRCGSLAVHADRRHVRFLVSRALREAKRAGVLLTERNRILSHVYFVGIPAGEAFVRNRHGRDA